MRVGLLEVTRLMSALVVGVTVAACNHNDDSGTQPTTQTYTLAVANGTVTAAPGGTATQLSTSREPAGSPALLRSRPLACRPA